MERRLVVTGGGGEFGDAVGREGETFSGGGRRKGEKFSDEGGRGRRLVGERRRERSLVA